MAHRISSIPSASLPLSWYLDPLYASLKRLICPPMYLAYLTRRQGAYHRRVPLPVEAFTVLLASLKEGDMTGVKRGAEEKLIPTSTTGLLGKWEYILR